MHRVRRGLEVLGARPRHLERVAGQREPGRGPVLLGDPLGDLGGAVVGAVVDQHDVLDGVEHRRQHPGQVAGLVLDPEDAGEPRGQRAVLPRPADGEVGRVGVAHLPNALRIRRRARTMSGSAAGRLLVERLLPALAAGRDHAGLGDRLGLVVERDVRLAHLVEQRVHVGGVATGLGELAQPAPGLLGDLTQPVRDRHVVPGRLHPLEVRVDELVHLADVVGARGLDRLEVELLTEPEHRDRPVGQQVVVPDEGPRALAGRALGVQHHVHPGRGALDLAERAARLAGRVVALLAADHLGDVPQHRDVRRLRVAAERRGLPEPQEPRQPRVLDHQLVDGRLLADRLLELRPQPVGQPGPGDAGGAGLAGLVPRRRPGVGHLDVAPLQQLVVEVDHPLRLREPLRVGLVGPHLGRRHVHAQRLQRARHGRRTAAPGADHEHDAALALGHGRQPSGRSFSSRCGKWLPSGPRDDHFPYLDANGGEPQSTRSVWAAMNWRYQSKERLGVRFWVSKSTWTRPKRWV